MQVHRISLSYYQRKLSWRDDLISTLHLKLLLPLALGYLILYVL